MATRGNKRGTEIPEGAAKPQLVAESMGNKNKDFIAKKRIHFREGNETTTSKQFQCCPRRGTREECREISETLNTMIRKAFAMSVHAGKEAEYEARHNPIWPELEAVLKSHGVHNYSIFLHPETHQLLAFVEIEDEARWNAIAQTDVCQKWWASMRDLMPSQPDNSPVSNELREVFHLD